MLKACPYCGQIHDKSYDCPNKPVRQKVQSTEAIKFRNTQRWRRKSREIMQRDMYLCQACRYHLQGTLTTYNSAPNLSVHHIISIDNNYDKRLDNDNLITLCQHHHELAERGVIHAAKLRDIAVKQEGNNK